MKLVHLSTGFIWYVRFKVNIKYYCCANLICFLTLFYLHIRETSFLLPCDKWSYHNLTLVYSYTRTELLSLGTKTSLLSRSTVDILKDLNIGYHLPRCHRSSRGVKRKKKSVHPFIVASFNAQSVKDNDMACKRCEISTFIKDNSVNLFFDGAT